MKIEITDIIYETDGETVEGLPPSLTVDVEDHDPETILKAVEGDWLVSGFDYRTPGGEWQQHREDMSWRTDPKGWAERMMAGIEK